MSKRRLIGPDGEAVVVDVDDGIPDPPEVLEGVTCDVDTEQGPCNRWTGHEGDHYVMPEWI